MERYQFCMWRSPQIVDGFILGHLKDPSCQFGSVSGAKCADCFVNFEHGIHAEFFRILSIYSKFRDEGAQLGNHSVKQHFVGLLITISQLLNEL